MSFLQRRLCHRYCRISDCGWTRTHWRHRSHSCNTWRWCGTPIVQAVRRASMGGVTEWDFEVVIHQIFFIIVHGGKIKFVWTSHGRTIRRPHAFQDGGSVVSLLDHTIGHLVQSILKDFHFLAYGSQPGFTVFFVLLGLFSELDTLSIKACKIKLNLCLTQTKKNKRIYNTNNIIEKKTRFLMTKF